MSVRPANVVELPRPQRAHQAQAVHKQRVMEECRRRVQAREVRRTAIAVLSYIAECVDKDSGLATLRLRTIAEATTYSRGEVGKAVQDLVGAGLVERISNRRGKECLAASFRLTVPVAPKRQPHRRPATTPSPAGDISRALNTPPDGLNPDGLVPEGERGEFEGGILAPPDTGNAIDWAELIGWLAKAGNYRHRFEAHGAGEAYRRAKQDVDRWRQRRGDRRVLAAISYAKQRRDGRGWFGDFLIERLGSMLDDG